MLRRLPPPLALVLAAAAILSVAWTFSTAPLQGPDEPAHVNYAQYLAETGGRPAVATGPHPDSTEVGTALTFLNLAQLQADPNARPAWSQQEERKFDEVDQMFGDEAEEDGAGPNPLGKNPPLYYAYEAIPYWVGSLGSFWDRLVVMRLASGVLFVITVLCAWLAAAEVFRGMWPRFMAAASVALLPQLAFLSGTVNSDNLLVTIWSAFAVAALRLVRRGPSGGRTALVCLLAAMSLVTHGRGLAIVVPLVAVLAVAYLRDRAPVLTRLRTLAPGVTVLAGAFALYRTLLAPEGGAYGGEVNVGGAGFSLTQFISTTWQFYFPALPFMDARPGPPYGFRQVLVERFFGQFANLEVSYPAGVYDILQLAVVAGLIALCVLAVRRRGDLRARWPELVVAVSMFAGMMGLLHAASYRALVGSGDPLITGRYVLPLVVVFALGLAFVLTSLPRRLGPVLGATLLGGLTALQLAGLVLTLGRFYG